MNCTVSRYSSRSRIITETFLYWVRFLINTERISPFLTVQLAIKVKTKYAATVSHVLLHKKGKWHAFRCGNVFFQALNLDKNLKKTLRALAKLESLLYKKRILSRLNGSKQKEIHTYIQSVTLSYPLYFLTTSLFDFLTISLSVYWIITLYQKNLYLKLFCVIIHQKKTNCLQM